MAEVAWLSVPVGREADKWVTRAGCRPVLVLVHTVAAGQRLLDVVGLIESDLNVQVVFTRVPDVFRNGTAEFVRSLGALEIPWQQAIHEPFSLVLSAAYAGLDEVRAPVMVLPHGAGYGKRVPNHADGASARRVIYGLDPQRLVRDGRPVAGSIVLSHRAQRRVLARQCRPALASAFVAGDPCYDRMLASAPARADYRAALDVPPGCGLLVVASTWGRGSLLGRNIDLLSTLLEQLDPGRYRVAALVHPAAWFGHGPRQIRAWLREPCAAGLRLIDPEVDWRAAVLAADHLIGDHGSVTTYAAALGVPVLQVDPAVDDLDPGSPQAWLAAHAPRLAPSRPVEPQLLAAADAIDPAAVTALLTSRPGCAHRVLRERLYRLLELPLPGRHRAPDPVPLPALESRVRHG